MPRVWKPSPPQPVPEATHNARLCPARSGSSVRRNFNSDEKNNNRNKSKCKSSKSKSRTKRKGLVPFELSDNGFSHGLKKSSPADTRILQVVRVNDDDDNIKDNHTLSRLASSFASRAKKSKTIHSDRSPSPPLTKRLKTSKSSSSFSPHINQQYPPRRVVLVTLSRSAVKGKDNNFDSPSPQARRGGRRSKLSPPKSRAVTSRTHFSGFDIKFAATRMRAKPIDLARRKNLRCRDTRGIAMFHRAERKEAQQESAVRFITYSDLTKTTNTNTNTNVSSNASDHDFILALSSMKKSSSPSLFLDLSTEVYTDMFQLAARTRRFGVDVQSVICTLGIDIVHFGGRTTSALSFSTANPFEQYPSVGEVDLALAPAPYCLRVDYDNDDILSDHPTSLELQEDCFIDGFLGSISASAIGEASGSNVSLLSTNLLDVLHLFSSQDAEGREELDKPFPLAVANDSNYLFYSNLSLVVPDKSNVERVRSKLDVLHYVPTAHSERAIFSAQIRTDKLRINTCTEDCGDASNSDHGVFTSTYRDHGNDQFDTVTNKRLSSNDLHVELFKFEMLDFLLPSSTVGFTHSTHKSYLFRSKLPIHTQGNSTARPPLFSLLSLSSSLPPGNRVKVMLVTPSLSSSIISTALSRQLVNSLLMLTTASPRRGHKAARNPTSISELDTNPSVHRDFLATSEDREETLLRQRTSLLLFMDAAGVFVDVGSAECDRLDYDDDSSLDKAAKFYEGFQVVNRDQDALDKHVEEIEMPLLNLDLASDAEGYLRLPVIERSTLPGPISGPLVITPVSPSLSSSSLPSHALSTLWFFLKNPSFTTRSEMATVSTIKLTWLQQNRLQDPNAPIEMPTFEVVDLSELIHEGVCVLNKFSAVTKSAPGKEKRKKRKKIPPKLNLDVLGISFVYIHREWGVQLLPISSVRPGLCVHNMVYTIPPFVSAIIQVAKLNLEDIAFSGSSLLSPSQSKNNSPWSLPALKPGGLKLGMKSMLDNSILGMDLDDLSQLSDNRDSDTASRMDTCMHGEGPSETRDFAAIAMKEVCEHGQEAKARIVPSQSTTHSTEIALQAVSGTTKVILRELQPAVSHDQSCNISRQNPPIHHSTSSPVILAATDSNSPAPSKVKSDDQSSEFNHTATATAGMISNLVAATSSDTFNQNTVLSAARTQLQEEKLQPLDSNHDQHHNIALVSSDDFVAPISSSPSIPSSLLISVSVDQSVHDEGGVTVSDDAGTEQLTGEHLTGVTDKKPIFTTTSKRDNPLDNFIDMMTVPSNNHLPTPFSDRETISESTSNSPQRPCAVTEAHNNNANNNQSMVMTVLPKSLIKRACQMEVYPVSLSSTFADLYKLMADIAHPFICRLQLMNILNQAESISLQEIRVAQMLAALEKATFRIRQATRQNISDQTRDALKAEVYDVLSLLCLSATLYQLQHRGAAAAHAYLERFSSNSYYHNVLSCRINLHPSDFLLSLGEMKACILNLVHSTQHTHIATKTPCHSVPTRSETDTITDHPKIDALIDICDSSLSHLPHSIEQQTEDAHNSATRKNRLSVLVLVGTKALVPVVLSGLSHAFDHTAFKVHHIPCSILVAEPCIYSQKKSHDRCPKTHNRTRLLSYSQHTRHQNKIKDKDKDQDQDQNQQQPPKEATSSDSKASALMLLLHQHDVLVAPFEWLWESASFPWEMIDTLVIYDPPQHQKHYLFASTTTAASYNIRVADDFGNLLQPPAYLNDLIVLTDSESPDQRQGLRDARQRLRVIKLSSVVDLQKDVSSNASVLSTTAKTCCDIKHHVASALLACGGLRVISHDDMPLMYPEVLELLHSQYNIQTIMRSINAENLVLDERTCIVIRKFEELQSDGDQFINRLAGMSMRYTYCHIIILMDADSLLVSGNAAKLNNVLMKLAASLSNHFPIETHMTYCYSMAACADAVALSAYRTGLNSKVWGNNLSNYAARDWMREDLSAQERLLSTFPSINPYTAQMILYGEELSLKEFFALAKVTTRDNGQNTQKDVDASAATKKLWYLPSKCIQDALTLAWADFGSGVNLEATIDVGYETVTQMRPDLSSEPTTAPAITTLLRAVEGSAAGSKHGNAVHVRETHYNNHTALGTDLATDANNDHKLHAKMEAIDRAYQKCNAGGNDDNAHNDSSRTSIVEIQDPCPDVSYQNQYQQQKQQQRDRQNELQNQGEQNPQYASSYGTNSIVNSYPVHSHSYQQEIESHPHKQAHDHDQNYHDTHHRHHGHESSPLLSSRSWSHSQPIPLSTSPSEMCIGQDDDYLASVAKYQQILQSPQFSTDQGADVHVAEHSQYQFKNQSQNSFQRRQHEYHRELLQELRETHCQEEYNPPQQWQQHSKSQFTPQHRESSYDQPHGVHQLHRKQYQRHQQRDHLSNACDDSSDIRNTFNQNIPEHTRSYYSNRPQYTDADNGTISNEGNINKHYDSSAEARISREHQLRGDHTRYHRSHGISSPSESDCHNRHHRQSFESLIPSSSALSQTMTDRLDTYTYATNSNDPHHDHRSSRMHGHSHNHSHHRHQNHAKKTDVNVSFHTPVSHRNARFVSESSDNDINALKQRSLGLRKQNGYGQKTGQTRLVWRQ